MKGGQDDKTLKTLKQMESSGRHMAHLTRQLLAYAREGKFNPQTVSLGPMVLETIPLIEHTLNPDVQIETSLPQSLSPIKVDTTQMQMVLSALIANANEAMDGPGRIRITAQNTDLRPEFVMHHGLTPGRYVCLIIEDEEMVMDLSRAMLKTLGYRVLEATTGEAAVELVKTFDGPIDLALLDIKLPDMTGKQVYDVISAFRPELKVVVCSGYSIDGPAREILNAGAVAFIQKPFSISDLSERLKQVLKRPQERRDPPRPLRILE